MYKPSSSITFHYVVIDRSCIDASRVSDVYENGVEEFLQFVQQNVVGINGRYFCPCVNFLNGRRLKIELIRGHVLCDDFLKYYTKWIWHGEVLNLPPVSQSQQSNEQLL